MHFVLLMQVEKSLSEKDVRTLREQGLLQSDEMAVLVGGEVIAENILSKTRRRLDTSGILLESKRTLLRG
jgi:hypothetical protein